MGSVDRLLDATMVGVPRRAIVLALALLAVAWCLPSSAFAHAEPATVMPGDGAVVISPPAQVRIETTQDMARQEGKNGIVVLDAAGNVVNPVPAQIDDANRRLISVPLPATMAPGKYTVRWTTLSADDGDTATGELSFTYDPNGTADPGKEQLAEGVLGATPTATATAPGAVATVPSVDAGGGGGDGTSWVLVAAVAVGMFVLGGGSAFLFVQRRP